MFELSEILDNTAKKDYKELGIFKFAKLFFPDRFKDDFAELHYDMCSLLFRLLDPSHTEATDRNSYFLVHREAAKTTVVLSYSLSFYYILRDILYLFRVKCLDVLILKI